MNKPKNKQQQPTPLSLTKKTPLRGLKNVLVQPHEILRPILRDEKEKSHLHSILTELLPTKKFPSREMSWAKLCRLSKKERSALMKNSQVKISNENYDNVMIAVILGINGVTKALEKNDICSILVDSNVEPLLIIKHIVTMGKNKKIPVLLVPFLKTVTLNRIGFACAALGIRKSVSEMKDEHFYKLHAKISALVDLFVEESLDASEIEIDSQTNVEKECLVKKCIDRSYNSTQQSLVSKSVYKYRPSPKKRAFIPPSSEPIAIQKIKLSTEFIALGNDNDNDVNTPGMMETARMLQHTGRYMDIHQCKAELSYKMDCETVENIRPNSMILQHSVVKNSPKTTYGPLKVKRIQGNSKRLKATKLAKSKKKVVSKK